MEMIEEAKECTPYVQGSELSVCSLHCPEDLQLHRLLVPAAKAALEHCIPHGLLPVGERRVQHGTSPSWLLYHLCKKVVVDTFKEPPALPVHCHGIPPIDVRVVEVSHEDQGL